MIIRLNETALTIAYFLIFLLVAGIWSNLLDLAKRYKIGEVVLPEDWGTLIVLTLFLLVYTKLWKNLQIYGSPAWKSLTFRAIKPHPWPGISFRKSWHTLKANEIKHLLIGSNDQVFAPIKDKNPAFYQALKKTYRSQKMLLFTTRTGEFLVVNSSFLDHGQLWELTSLLIHYGVQVDGGFKPGVRPEIGIVYLLGLPSTLLIMYFYWILIQSTYLLLL